MRIAGSSQIRVLAVEGLVFPEGPRWRGDRLWFSDIHGHRVHTFKDGELRTEVEVPGAPSGLGWLPDGRLLVVSMEDQRVLVVGDTVETFADLAPHIRFHANDMVTDSKGRSFVSNFGFDVLGGEAWRSTTLVCVASDGTARVVADEMMFPNGMVLTDGGETLVVAESPARHLTAFTVAPNGDLSERRIWATLPGLPDGICLDAEGAIWAALSIGGTFEDQTPSCAIRVLEGGEVTDKVERSDGFDVYACTLGGPDGRTLFLMEARSPMPGEIGPGNGRIRAVAVAVAAGGSP